MEMLRDLFNNERFAQVYTTSGKQKGNERSTLLKELSDLTTYELGRVIHKTGHLKDTRDLYYLLSVMKDDVRTGRKTSYKHSFNSALFVVPK